MFANRPSRKPYKLSQNQRKAMELIACAPGVDGSGCGREWWHDQGVKVRTVMSLISNGLVESYSKRLFGECYGKPLRTVRLYRVTEAGRKALKGEA